MTRHWRHFAAWLALLALLMGCGTGQLKPASGVDPADQLLNQAVVNKTPAGPERALYQWWLYVQYNDEAGYTRMLAPALREQRGRDRTTDRDLVAASRALDLAVPQVTSIDQSGDKATIYTSLIYHQLVGSSRYITVQAPQAFSLVQVAGRWYISDDRFIAQQAGH